MIAIAMSLEAVATPSSSSETYYCEHVGAVSKGPHDPLRQDMKLSRIGSPDSLGEWYLTWPSSDARSVAVLGSGLGFIAVRLPDEKGKMRRAAISMGDVATQDGSKYLWLNYGDFSMWQPPGFYCSTTLSYRNGRPQ